jgi:hypothetical protein
VPAVESGRVLRPPIAAGGWYNHLDGGLPVPRAGTGGWGCGLRFGGLKAVKFGLHARHTHGGQGAGGRVWCLVNNWEIGTYLKRDNATRPYALSPTDCFIIRAPGSLRIDTACVYVMCLQ